MEDRISRARKVRRYMLTRQQQGYEFVYGDYRLLTRYVLGELNGQQLLALCTTKLFACCQLGR